MADPSYPEGLHPLHNHRFVTTESMGVEGEDFDGEGSIICALRDQPMQEADARLIAAAPDLLEALKAWEFARKEGGISHADFFEAAWQKTQAAIAKAEGAQ